MAKQLRDTQQQGQSIWYDNVSRGLLTSGEMAALVESGITGLTSNPTIFEKAISGSNDYDEALLALALAGSTATEAFESMAMEDIRAVADLLRPVYDATDGADGFASLEVSPTLAHDTEGTVAEAHRLFAALDRPNVMVKVPGTPAGVPAVERLIGEGVNINVTLLFHRDAYTKVREAYTAGLERFAASGGDLRRVASVASFFVSRVDAAVDGILEPRVKAGEEELADLLGKAAIANAALAYRDFQETAATERFAALRAKGARVQRPLWASTGTKKPRLQRRPLHRVPHRARHRQHHAACHPRQLPRSRAGRAHAGALHPGGRAGAGRAGGRGRQHGRGHGQAPRRRGQVLRRFLHDASGQRGGEEGRAAG